MAGLRLKKLVIERFRNVRPGTTLSFSDGMNVLLGKNGTGKSTLLELVAAVASGHLAQLFKDEEADVRADFTYGAECSYSVRVRSVVSAGRANKMAQAAPQTYQVYFEGTLSLGDDEVYEIIQNDSGLRTRRLRPSESSAPPGFRLEHAPEYFIHDVILGTLLDWYSTTGDALESVARGITKSGAALHRFDESLEHFYLLLGRTSSEKQVPPTQVAFVRSEKEPWLAGFSAGTSLLEQVKHRVLDVPTPLTPTLTISSNVLPFLKRSESAFGFASSDMTLRLSSLQNVTEKTRGTYGEGAFFFVAKDGSGFTEMGLSFGQKRLLSFFHYAECNPDIVVADELVNGLHYEWARLCLDTISDRQAFLSSQDPLLFDYLTFESVEQVEQSLILCTLNKSEDGKGQFVWKNVPREEAEAFFRSYENGLQHVSEILKAKGLW